MDLSYKRLYADARDDHVDLMDAQLELMEMGRTVYSIDRVTGTESLQEKTLQSLQTVGRGLFSVSKWVGGKALDGFIQTITAAGNQLLRSFESNDKLISTALRGIEKRADHPLKLSAKQVALITASGDVDHLQRDLDALIKALESQDKHAKDLQSFLDKELFVLKKLKAAKKPDEVHRVIEEFEGLRYPVFELAQSMGEARKSDPLPGGRFFVFTHKEGTVPVYSIGGDTPEGEGAEKTFSKSELSELLNKLQKVNALHKRVKASYENYLSFIKSWADMVKGVDGNLSELTEVSKTVIGEAEKLMTGNTGALAFYSAFTPRVVGYTDKYIHGVLGVFA